MKHGKTFHSTYSKKRRARFKVTGPLDIDRHLKDDSSQAKTVGRHCSDNRVLVFVLLVCVSIVCHDYRRALIANRDVNWPVGFERRNHATPPVIDFSAASTHVFQSSSSIIGLLTATSTWDLSLNIAGPCLPKHSPPKASTS